MTPRLSRDPTATAPPEGRWGRNGLGRETSLTSKWRCQVHCWGCDLSSVSRAAGAGGSRPGKRGEWTGRKARGLDEMGEVSVGRGGQQSGLSSGTFLGGGRKDEEEPANELSRNSQ